MSESGRAAAKLLTRTARDLFEMGCADLALPVARLALEADAANGDAHSVMAGILDASGAFGDGLLHWREAVRQLPHAPRQRLNLALALLGAGDWEAGLPLYEARLETNDWSIMAARPSLDVMNERAARPDTDLAGRRVLVVTEQGLGDSIWSARFLAPLAARCGELALATGAALRPLLALVDGPARIIAPPEGSPREARINLRAAAAECDHIVPLMSLPWLLSTRPAPPHLGAMPYLAPDPGLVAAWRDKFRNALPMARHIVGLIWRANPAGPAATSRSIPVERLAPLHSIADVGFVILQGGDTMVRRAIEPVLPGIVDGLADSIGPPGLDAFAAAIAATDLLVSVDTMGAHLAGAMAHPGIVLLPTAPSFCGLFWGNQGDRSLWYPSLRLIRQTRHQDWDGPVAAVRAALEA